MIALDTVRIHTDTPPLSFTGVLMSDEPVIDNAFGGWELIDRPGRSPITSFKAPPARTVEVAVIADGWRDRQSVEPAIDALAAMAQQITPALPPPVVQIEAPGVRIPAVAEGWIITSLAFSEGLRGTDGVLYRMAARLTLTEFVSDATIKPVVKEPRKQRGKWTRARKVKARSNGYDGETLLMIAKRTLGDADKWKRLAKLNKIRDPRAIRAGDRIRYK